jgi:hypothetical protein
VVRPADKRDASDGIPSENALKGREENSVSKDTAARAASSTIKTPSPVKALFDFGVSVLTAAGVPDRQARSAIGKWRKLLRDDAKLMALLVSAQQNNAVEPIAYLEKAVAAAQLKAKYGSGYVPPGVGG